MKSASQTVEKIRLTYPVPYYAQLASPEWTTRVFDQGVDPAEDPRREEFGLAQRDEYCYWVTRDCGAVCVKMVVEALGGPVHPVMEWIRLGIARDGYRFSTMQNGKTIEVGWVHSVLAELITAAGFPAYPCRANLLELVSQLKNGSPAIISISYEVGSNRPVTQNRGHLAVLTGCDLQAGQPVDFLIHNPSGRSDALRRDACISIERFTLGYSGRAILVGQNPAS